MCREISKKQSKKAREQAYAHKNILSLSLFLDFEPHININTIFLYTFFIITCIYITFLF